MKKIGLIFLIAFFYTQNCFSADIIISFPENFKEGSIEFFYAPIDKLISAQSKDERGLVAETFLVKDNIARISVQDNLSGYQAGLELMEGNMIPLLYIIPGTDLNIEILSLNPLEYKITGSPLYDSLNDLLKMEEEFNFKRSELRKKENVTEEEHHNLVKEYNDLIKDYIKINQDNEGSLLALRIGYLGGDDFIKFYTNIPDYLETSIVYPLLKAHYNALIDIEATKIRQQEMEKGNVIAPDFTLKDTNGNNISLSDFKGKWVILDFWGSWCGWCIKGFPGLKEAYEKYGNEMVIIGIDCNDTKKDWLDALEKYRLPWINLYNPQDSNVLKDYEIQVFPTKIIINPEGKIYRYVTGEDPNFFEELAQIFDSMEVELNL